MCELNVYLSELITNLRSVTIHPISLKLRSFSNLIG